MASKEYIERLQMVIRQLHGTDSNHIESVPVLETFRGQTVWQGEVDVFELLNHPKTRRCYAWSYKDKTKGEQFTAVLGVPPINSALDAVRASIVADSKRKMH